MSDLLGQEEMAQQGLAGYVAIAPTIMLDVSEMKMTEQQCKLGIVIGLILAMVIPVLSMLVPFAFSALSVATGTATHESLVRDIRIQEQLHIFRTLSGIVGTLIVIPSWILLRRRRREEELR
jgi:hypothetical protein